MDKAATCTSAVELCAFGDQRIAEETEKVFKKEKNMKKGNPFFGILLFFSKYYDAIFNKL